MGRYASDQDFTHGLQHTVAHDVAARVVDVLEMIDVKHDQAMHSARQWRAGQHVCQLDVNTPAVVHARERVAQRFVTHQGQFWIGTVIKNGLVFSRHQHLVFPRPNQIKMGNS